MAVKRHRLIPQSLARSTAFKRDFKETFTLSAQQIDKLVALAETEKGLELPAESMEEAARNLEITSERIASVLHVLDFLYDHARVGNISKEDATEQVSEFAKSLAIADCDEKVAAIEHVFSPKEAYDKRLMVENIGNAVIPTLSGIDSVCDVRAVTDRNTGKIIGYIPRALIGIEIEDSDLTTRTVSLQVDEKDIDRLIEELHRAKSLLMALKDEFGKKILDAEQKGD